MQRLHRCPLPPPAPRPTAPPPPDHLPDVGALVGLAERLHTAATHGTAVTLSPVEARLLLMAVQA